MFGNETSFPGPQYGLSSKLIPYRQSSLETKTTYRVSQKMYLCLMHCKTETKRLILEIGLVPERKFSNLNFAP